MTVVPVAYDIPEDILAGLVSGALTRFGSVVRDHTGIIAHLKEIDLSGSNDAPDGDVIAAALRNSKVLVGLGVVVILAAAGGLAIWAAKKKSVDQPVVPSSVREYNAALAAYLEAIQDGSLNVDILYRVISALEAIETEVQAGEIKIEFTAGASEALVNLVAEYTRTFAEANSVDLNDRKDVSLHSPDSPIVDLRHWLEVQKGLFDEAA